MFQGDNATGNGLLATKSAHASIRARTLFEQVAAPVSRLRLAVDRMRQCHFDYFAGKFGPLGCRVAKRRPKSMHGQIIAAHALKQLEHGHVAERLARSAAGEDKIVVSWACVAMSSSARSDSGTRCSLPAFMRSAGTAQSFSRMLNSERRAPIASPVRAGGQNCKFQRARRNSLLLPQSGQERRQFGVRQRAVVPRSCAPLTVTAIACRGARASAPGFRPGDSRARSPNRGRI